MSLEGFSKRGMELGSNPEGIKETNNDARHQYLNAIKSLALQKMKNDILFNGSLVAAIRRLSSLGLDVSRESMLKDIQKEIYSQSQSLDIDNVIFGQEIVPPIIGKQSTETPMQVSQDIEKLKTNMANIFEYQVEKTKPINMSEAIPREPAMQSPNNYGVPRNNLNSQQDKQEIKENLENENQKSNKISTTYADNLKNLPNEVKQKIIQQMESRGEVIISGIDNIYQEGNYIVVDAKDNQGRFTGTEFTLEEFAKLINQSSSKTQSQSSQEQMKNIVVQQIINAMNEAGELSFGNISMSERMSIMQSIQNKLNNKSIEELQILLSAYQSQIAKDETAKSGKHR